MARIATEVEKFEGTRDGARVDVRVDSLAMVPDEFQELRARARALAAAGFAGSAAGVLDNIELDELNRLTQTLEVRTSMSTNLRETKIFTVKVDSPFSS